MVTLLGLEHQDQTSNPGLLAKFLWGRWGNQYLSTERIVQSCLENEMERGELHAEATYIAIYKQWRFITYRATGIILIRHVVF